MNGLGWIGIDLDGTLANSNDENLFDVLEIGSPIPEMVNLARLLVENGYQVKVFTARVAVMNDQLRNDITSSIQDWTQKHIGYRLPVTCVKDMQMIAMFDDKAVGVRANTGMITGKIPAFLDVYPFSHCIRTWKAS